MINEVPTDLNKQLRDLYGDILSLMRRVDMLERESAFYNQAISELNRRTYNTNNIVNNTYNRRS
jgi:hypothetical protein